MSKSLIIIAAIITFFSTGHRDTTFIGNVKTTDCADIQANFIGRSKIIAWDEDTSGLQIDRSFYNKYLSGLEEFRNKEAQALYYHSVPDIRTDMCLVIVKSVTKDEKNIVTQFQYKYAYYLIDLTEKPKILLELAAFEESVDSQRRVYSEFVDNKTLIWTRITEHLTEFDNLKSTWTVKSDSTVFWYAIEEQRFSMTKGLGTLTTKIK